MSISDLCFGQRVIWRRSSTEQYPAEIVDIEHVHGRIQIRARVPDEDRRLFWVRIDELESGNGTS